VSLDVSLLSLRKIQCEQCGHAQPISADPQQIYSDTLTENLRRMAMEADLYEVLWRPELVLASQDTLLNILHLEARGQEKEAAALYKELGVVHAKDLIAKLRVGFARLRTAPDWFRASNPGNGIGSFEDLTSFVEKYLAACEESPDAIVRLHR
jgi:hypothetical protein